MQGCVPFGLEDQFGGGVDAAFDRPCEGVECRLDRFEEVWSGGPSVLVRLSWVAAVGLLDTDQSALFVDVLPLQGAEFALAQAGTERDGEEMEIEEVGLSGAARRLLRLRLRA
jgi:hypothetical protein